MNTAFCQLRDSDLLTFSLRKQCGSFIIADHIFFSASRIPTPSDQRPKNKYCVSLLFKQYLGNIL